MKFVYGPIETAAARWTAQLGVLTHMRIASAVRLSATKSKQASTDPEYRPERLYMACNCGLEFFLIGGRLYRCLVSLKYLDA